MIVAPPSADFFQDPAGNHIASSAPFASNYNQDTMSFGFFAGLLRLLLGAAGGVLAASRLA